MPDINTNQDQYSDPLSEGPEYNVLPDSFLTSLRLRLGQKLVDWGISIKSISLVILALGVVWATSLYLEPVLSKALVEKSQSKAASLIVAPVISGIKVEGSPVIIPRGDGSSVAVVYLRNPNKAYGLGKIDYSWQAFANDTVVATGQGSTYMLPEDDRYIILPVAKSVPTKVTFEISEHKEDFVRTGLRQKGVLEVVEKQFQSTPEGYEVSFTVVNSTPYSIESVDLAVLARNPGGIMRAGISTIIGPLGPGATKPVRVVWPEPLPVDTIIDIRPSTNMLSSSNVSYRPIFDRNIQSP